MLFNSHSFALFLACVVLVHRLLPWRAGKVFLVAASYLFYGLGEPLYISLLLASTLIDFTVSASLGKTQQPLHRKCLLAVSLAGNLGLLGFFKYADFALQNWRAWVGGSEAAPALGWVLPIGISFYTFQTLSYTLDVYSRKIEPCTDFFTFALYVSFFPQLVAGPIERAGRLLPQLSVKQKATLEDLEDGFERILIGLVKKVVLADRFGLFVDAVYAEPETSGGAVLLLATVCFALQIYFDFSGYCDIAIGSARLLGIRLTENFRAPILARNPADFWARWHVTLGTWFRDYVYTRALGRRPGKLRQLLAPVLVMTLIGLWHGASWNFVLFGLLAGFSMAAYEGFFLVTGRPRRRPLLGTGPASAPLAIVLTGVHSLLLVVFFRSPTFEHAVLVLWRLAAPGEWPAHASLFLVLALVCLLGLVVSGWWTVEKGRALHLPPPLRAFSWCLLMLALNYGAIHSGEQFIYFQF